jgi:catechol 2,3-dioxygenase-like lactoylglutathione lyase family enzyme
MHPFSIQHIDHIVLRVADLQRSIDFYRQVFGAEVVSTTSHWVWCTCAPALR